MKLYELIINEEEDSGVEYIALVDAPAIESNWQMFGKQKQQFTIESEEKRLISGYLMKADLPILRVHNGEEFHVVFKSETVIEIVKKFMKNGFTTNTNLSHDKNQLAEGVYLIESLIVDSERGTKAPNGFEDAPNGSWFGTMFVENDKIWDEIKSGKFKGFSVEGMFLQRKSIDVDEEKINQIKEVIKDFFK